MNYTTKLGLMKCVTSLWQISCVLALSVGGLITSERLCRAQASHPLSQATTKRSRITQPKTAVNQAELFNYDQVVLRAKTLVSARPQDALGLCKQAIQHDPGRYEAHVIAAEVLRQQKQYSQAVVHLQIAQALAPEDQIPGIRRAISETKVASLPADSRRKLDSLILIVGDAQGSRSPGEREKFLREFLTKSGAFLTQYPSISDLWLLRAQIAVEVNEPKVGWQAGRKLIELGEDRSEDPFTRKLMATLERKGWLDQKAPLSKEEEQEENRQKISGVWRCTQQQDVTYLDLRYSAGTFSIGPLGDKQVTFATDGVPHFERDATGTSSRQSSWSGLVLTNIVKRTANAEESMTRQALTLSEADLVIESEGNVLGQNYRGTQLCQRVDRSAAEAELGQRLADARAAVKDFLDFVRERALYVADVKITNDCELQWTELGSQAFGRGYTDLPRSISLTDDDDSEVKENQYGPRYSFRPYHSLGNIFFTNFRDAVQAQKLYRKADRLCWVPLRFGRDVAPTSRQ